MWESNFWKSIVALSVILGIIVSILTIPQRLSGIDLWTPVANFFTMLVPLWAIPLTIIIVVSIIVAVAYFGNTPITINDPLAGTDVLMQGT